MHSVFHRLGLFIAARPVPFLVGWAIVIGLGVWGGGRFSDAAQGGTAGLYGSQSKAVSDALLSEFDNPFLDPLMVVIETRKFRADDEAVLAWTRDGARLLRGMPEVKQVAAYADRLDPQLRSTDGRQMTMLVGLAATDVPAQQRAVPRVREALEPLRARLLRMDPAAVMAVTGDPAVSYDINTASAKGGDHAEKRALPLTLGILVFAFGTLIAALLPFLMGLATTMVSLGLAFMLAHLMPVSNLLGNVVTMIGLAVGIDYSLLMVKDYRERLSNLTAREAVAATVAESGSTIWWSGSTVALGLLGLLFSPILETRSVGIGGALVVLVSILAALTLLPACLALLGTSIERWPILPRRKIAEPGTKTAWAKLAEWTLRRPVVTLLVSSAAVGLLALPALGAHSGFAHERWFLPKGLESRVGADLLAKYRSGNEDLIIQALVRTTDQLPILADAHLGPLTRYQARLRNDPRVASMASPLEANAARRALYLSKDGRAALFEATPAEPLSADQVQRLAGDLANVVPDGPFTVTLGGAPVYHNEFRNKMWASFPKVFGSVVLATLVVLFAAFRSFLLPIKAVIANVMAIAAGYGVVVAIFQFGWLHGLIGLEHPFAAIPLEVPLMIFCLSFGLSMDYELFLLFRIQREYDRHRDNDRATVEGLAAVAPVITGAGLIMTVVFGAFASADLPTLKMIGVGLCVAVLVDATAIRGLVVPAFMSVAGRWNWYPGRR